ncbi:MAG: hypothetical protein BJ554DRAFT_1568 [Olpidium bornovanus]|uniref:Ribosomal protein L32 n=1 Tax=Olpidium bornovanus TaxID=278681 RepID=A0A8H8DGZ7_9FUNG|nr:MAG: hypothetical protein BJ554DRAFT_1568 [Olpidium bornovanus]
MSLAAGSVRRGILPSALARRRPPPAAASVDDVRRCGSKRRAHAAASACCADAAAAAGGFPPAAASAHAPEPPRRLAVALFSIGLPGWTTSVSASLFLPHPAGLLPRAGAGLSRLLDDLAEKLGDLRALLAAPKQKSSRRRTRQDQLAMRIRERRDIVPCPICGRPSLRDNVCLSCVDEVRRQWKAEDMVANQEQKERERAQDALAGGERNLRRRPRRSGPRTLAHPQARARTHARGIDGRCPHPGRGERPK